VIAIIAVTWIGMLAYKQLWHHPVKAIVISSGEIMHTIVASGHVESPHRISISAQITGSVTQIPVVEGQFVERGQILVQLENSESQFILKQTLAIEQQALTSIRQLQELKVPVAQQTYLQAYANFINAQRGLSRSLTLHSQGFVGTAARDDALRTVQVAQSQLMVTQKQLASLQPDGSDFALAQSAALQANAAADAARARLRYSTISAPKTGTLIVRNVEVGDGVQAGKVLMVISPQGTIQLVVQIDEKNMKWLHLNQMAIASADAFPDQKFQAQLTYINPRIDPQRGSVEVKLNVINPPAILKQDMTVSVDIEALRRNHILLIPINAIHDYGQQTPWVLVIKNGIAQQRGIQLGLENKGIAEVRSGLIAGDQVVPVHEAHIYDGTLVHVIAP